jgi:hypothetical protein
VAEAVRLALTADVEGHEVCFIAASDSFMPIPSRVLVADHYPTTVIHDELTDYVSLLSSAKAEALLGFRARHSWRSYDQEAA